MLYQKKKGIYYAKENNNIKIIANEEYFKVDNLTIIPIKKGTNIPIIIYNGFNKTTFFVTISETKNVDLKIMGHPFYSKDEVSINFNYNEPFLNLSKYNIQDVVIGDIIRMYYTGDYFYTEMTWNNFVTVSNIIHVEKSYEAIPYTFIIDENYVPIIIDNEIEYKFHHTVYIYEQYYVINEDNLYTTTDKLEIGQTIYGFAWGNNPNEIASLYTYNPKE